MSQNDSKSSVHTLELTETRTQSSKGMGRGFRFRTVELVRVMGRLVKDVITNLWQICAYAALMFLLAFWMHGGILTLFLLVVAIVGVFYNIQDMLLFHPDKPNLSRLYVKMPSLINLPYESHFIRTKDGVRINVVLIKRNVNDPTIVHFHGNAGNIGDRLLNCHGLFHHLGCNILLVEYRGYGKSEGTPSESGLYRDAEAAMDFILARDDINQEKIVVFGRSLGGAVAIWLASQPHYANHIAALVVENTFLSLPAIGRKVFHIKPLEYLPDICFKHKFRSADRIRNIKLPTYFMSGLEDKLIPPIMMRTLFLMSGSTKKKMNRFDTGTHNETFMHPGYYGAFAMFLKNVGIISKS